MDNRIANDMISSGMIPSGEKKKEDLSRIQYGSAPSPNALLDAYKSMYDKKEEVINEHHKKDADGNTIPHEHEEELNEGKIPAGLQAYLDKKKGKKEDKKEMKEGLATAAKMALGLVKNMAKKKVVKNLARNVATGAAMSAGSNLMSGGGGGQQPMTKKTSSISASADLFDIVKGQLLDEGLSEEEIRDIMLTLTPDEIMSEMAVNPKIAAMDAKNKADMIARAKAKEVPQNVRDASKRQYTAGGPKDTGANKYTTQDKKTIINYNKNKESM